MRIIADQVMFEINTHPLKKENDIFLLQQGLAAHQEHFAFNPNPPPF